MKAYEMYLSHTSFYLFPIFESKDTEAAKGAKYAFDTLETLAECEEVDAVYVASPNACHAKQSILMMEHGKHVLCTNG